LDTLAHGTFARYTLNATYADAVIAAGGLPVILPFQNSETASLLDRLDGLLLSGGADLEPARFGAGSVHPETYGVSPERDEFELRLTSEALRCATPVLGVCRGIQVLNVALGGSLIQDIPSEHPTATPVQHRQHIDGIPANQPGHLVTIAPCSLLDEGIGDTVLPVNSFHHQAIDRLAPDLTAIAHAGDGTIEAVVMPERRFVLGVQWHPELMFADHPAQLALFGLLVDAARAHHEQAVAALA
jgi:putative glutamine amidotransferase